MFITPRNDQLMTLIGNTSLNIEKEYEMCQEMSFFNFGDGKHR